MSFHCFAQLLADVVNPDVGDAKTKAEDRQDRDSWSRLVSRIDQLKLSLKKPK